MNKKYTSIINEIDMIHNKRIATLNLNKKTMNSMIDISLRL